MKQIYWVRGQPGLPGTHLIFVDNRKKQTRWYDLSRAQGVAHDDTISSFMDRVSQYPRIYHPITRKQFITARIIGEHFVKEKPTPN